MHKPPGNPLVGPECIAQASTNACDWRTHVHGTCMEHLHWSAWRPMLLTPAWTHVHECMAPRGCKPHGHIFVAHETAWQHQLSTGLCCAHNSPYPLPHSSMHVCHQFYAYNIDTTYCHACMIRTSCQVQTVTHTPLMSAHFLCDVGDCRRSSTLVAASSSLRMAVQSLRMMWMRHSRTLSAQSTSNATSQR